MIHGANQNSSYFRRVAFMAGPGYDFVISLSAPSRQGIESGDGGSQFPDGHREA